MIAQMRISAIRAGQNYKERMAKDSAMARHLFQNISDPPNPDFARAQKVATARG